LLDKGLDACLQLADILYAVIGFDTQAEDVLFSNAFSTGMASIRYGWQNCRP
jgi:hypothetical protein